MTEKLDNAETIESKIARVTEWIGVMSEKQEVGQIPREVIKDVLEFFGADFKNLNEDGKESLRGYSEKERSLGVNQVWGEEMIKNYKSWVKKYISGYDEVHEIKLPILGEKEGLPYPLSGRKNSGMLQFLYELTSFASGETSFDDYKKYMEARVNNGIAFAEGRKEDRVRVKVPTAKDPILLGSIPKEFPMAVIDWIKNREKVDLITVN